LFLGRRRGFPPVSHRVRRTRQRIRKAHQVAPPGPPFEYHEKMPGPGRPSASTAPSTSTPATSAPELQGSGDPRIGTLFGHFRIVRKIGEGGMGMVYEAEQKQIKRRAAVKILHTQFAEDEEYTQRFLDEARAVNVIQHPGIVEIFDFGRREDGEVFFVM